MRVKITVLLLFIFLQKINSQNEDWNTYDLDSIVSIDMPFTVYEIDTIIDFNKQYQIYSINESSKFTVQKLYIEKSYSNIEMPPLPKDSESLKKYYLNIIWTLDEMISYKMDDYYPIQKNNLKGYEIVYVDENDTPVQQIVLILVNKNLYNFSYVNKTGLNEFDKNSFFNSISFNDAKELRQYPKEPYFSIKKILLILVGVFIISFILRVISKK